MLYLLFTVVQALGCVRSNIPPHMRSTIRGTSTLQRKGYFPVRVDVQAAVIELVHLQ